MPDLRIVDEDLATRVRGEIVRRRHTDAKPTNRSKHLLSGLTRCGACGSSYTMAGKDYSRCARNRERGTCSNSASLRLAIVEDAVLSALQTELLPPDLVKLFTEEFRREVERQKAALLQRSQPRPWRVQRSLRIPPWWPRSSARLLACGRR